MPESAMHRLILALVLAAGSAPAPATTRTDSIVMQGNRAGTQTVGAAANGARVEYSYNDRGRGDHIVATWTLDAAGIPVAYEGRGNDYMKAPVEETFSLVDGTASWRNRTEQGERALDAPAFYVPANAPPEMIGVLARALLRAPGHRLALLPMGEARIEAAGETPIDHDGRRVTLRQYRISGLGFTPQPVWLDADGNTVAMVSAWFSVLPQGREAIAGTLQDAQDTADHAWAKQLAQELARKPKGDLLIRDARLFDPRDLTVTPGSSVLVRGERIVRVAPGAEIAATTGTEVVDARGRFLMPGMWDNHQHFSDVDGLLDLANGVTSARDMANDTDAFIERVARFDDGSEIGPRVLRAGIIDGTGELAGPTKMRVDSEKAAIEAVDWYADHGYVQVKIYSSVKAELMPVIADRAHERGLRVSGHVPAFMSARQFIEGGADELQHLNFVFLNFLYPEVKETRNRDRFIKVAERAHEFSPDRPEVRDFIALLKRRHVVIDPTLGIFEGLFSGDPAAVTPGLETVAPRLPPQIRRAMLSGALDVPQGQEAAYRDAFPAMLKMLKALHEAGVTIVPGTDGLAGYMLHHELAVYARAGIAPLEVLRMATLTPAEVMGVDDNRGVIAAGLYADMVLVDGDPARDIGDIREIDLVVKGGRLYDPPAIERAIGITPRG
jgi:cytosine/adenosine deaminase-related metal-dependent hydrolase